MSIHQPRPYQAKLESECWTAWQSGAMNVLAVLPTGGGKCLGRGTKVLTYDGCQVPVEDIEPGDDLMGPDSLRRTVLSVCRGREMLYRVTPVKGEPYVVNESHILSLKSTPQYPGQPVRIVNLSVRDYLQRSKWFRHTHKGWRTGVDFPKAFAALPIDPYFLGVWLGDGNAHNATITTGDAEIRAFLYEHAASIGMVAADRVIEPGCVQVVMQGTRRVGRGGTPIMNALRRLGVLGNKHVPYAYRTASRGERLQLLAGLMDTDGSYTHKGFDYISVSERLADDVVFVARSLGLAAYKASCVKTCVNNGVSGTYYRVSISGDVSVIPCRLPRKQAKPRLQKKDVLVTGITVEPIGEGDYFGFEIDGDHLFLLGDFTVTHNTFIFSRIAAAFAAQGHAVAASAHRAELVSQMSLAMAREGVRHRVIGQASLTRNCTAIHMLHFKRSFVDPNALVGVCSVDTLVNMDPSNPWFRRVALWIQDECFPAGTLVDGRPIETIRVGDRVRSYNEKTGRVEVRRVSFVFKNRTTMPVIRITSAGRSVVATLEHPFLTKRGWVPALRIQYDDVLLHALPEADTGDERSAALPVPQDGQDLLSEGLRVRPAGRQSESSAANAVAPERSAVHGMREGCRPLGATSLAVPQDGQGVLFAGVLEPLPGDPLIANDGGNEPHVCLAAHVRTEPDAQRGNARADGSVVAGARAQANGSRGQWLLDSGAGASAERDAFGSRVSGATAGADCRHSDPRGASLLQGGRGAPDSEDRSGSGRAQPLGQTESIGPETGCRLAWAGVDRIEVLQPYDPDYPMGGLVFNLEVDGTHTYFANDVVVHNCHHVLRDNKWGKACALFPQARGLGVTATPLRADGKGLGRHADGVFDVMVTGPYMRELIDAGYLCDYVIKQPPSNIDLSAVPITDSGDFSPEKLRAARRRSTITGDVVQHYLKWTPGKLGVTFDTDIESATETAEAFRSAGVPAEIVTAKTPDMLREDIKRRFASRQILQLVNVDLFGEGYDLPAIEVVSMARPTESYGLYVQQFGRALRTMEGKQRAIILDHVGNVLRHGGPPDVPREWTLDRRERRSRGVSEGVIPLRTCLNPECLQPYERVLRACPYCGFEPVVGDRSAPEKVDGDLVDLDPRVAEQIRAEIQRIRSAPSFGGVPRVAYDSFEVKHKERAEAHRMLDAAIALWGGWQTHLGRSVSEAQRRFFFTFGVDVGTARTLGRPEAEALTERVHQHLKAANVQGVTAQ